ncbi:DUF2934 domain-containing protein [Paraburkholderia sp. IW21]|uniref:DUF2934 domain-containing protein n=1 Tax=Paraburkholderia sp. IW21 TaxID=3242488 RepID=UPI0035216350
MSATTVEEKIRARAYELWQLDGALEGCADEYWRTARALVEKETTAPGAAGAGDPDARHGLTDHSSSGAE